MTQSNVSTVKASEIDLKEKVVAIQRVAKVVKEIVADEALHTLIDGREHANP